MEMTKEIKTKFMANSNISRKNIIIGNFLGGLAWGIGTIIGAAIVFAFLIPSLNLFKFIPVVGELVSQIQRNTETGTNLKR